MSENTFDQDALTRQFVKNLTFFKSYAPALYKEFSVYQAQDHHLAIDDNNHFNILSHQNWLYAWNTVLEQKKKIHKTVKLSANGECNLVIQGIGLGINLPELFETDAKKIFIYEPDKDYFFASLFCFDYEQIINHFNRIELIIGSQDDFLQKASSDKKTLFIQLYQNIEFEQNEIIIKKRSDKIKKAQKMLSNNITFFEKKIPSLYHYFKDYSSEKFYFVIDNNNNENIRYNNTYIYLEDHQSITQNQTEASVKSGFYLRSVTEPDLNPNSLKQFIHTNIVNEIAAMTKVEDHPCFTPTIVFLGSGLGYHISKIAALKKNLISYIFEPETDIFYASLHTTDYEHLLTDPAYGSIIHFIIGQDELQLVALLEKNALEHGVHYSSNIQLVEHYSTPKIDTASKELRALYARSFQQFGFFEDECLGVAHTVHHINPNEIFYKPSDPEPQKEFALIVASGPSIDNSIATIQKIREKVIIISCSSSIEILHKNGIIPDYHAETERTHAMSERLDALNDPDYLKQITLLTINTIHPDVLNRFKNRINFFKSNDIGEKIFKAVSNTDYPEAFFCNPTSGNAAVAFTHALGFKKLIFTGLDFGQKDDKSHHSKHTLYYSDTKHKLEEIKSSRTVAANFGGEVKTNSFLLQAKHVVELFLKYTQGITCYNCGEGALIQGATSLKISELLSEKMLPQNIDRAAIKQKIIKTKTVSLPDNQKQIIKLQKDFNNSWKTILNNSINICKNIFPPEAEKMNIKELYEYFSQSQAKLNNKKSNIIEKKLIQGSFDLITLTTFSALNTSRNIEEMQQKIKVLKPLWFSYFNFIHRSAVAHIGITNDKMNIQPYLKELKQYWNSYSDSPDSSSENKSKSSEHLTAMFVKNMSFFKKFDRDIYDRFINYSAGPNQLGIDDSGQFNITIGDGWLYPENQKEVIKIQIEKFISSKPCIQMTNSLITKTVKDATTKSGINKFYHQQLNLIHPSDSDDFRLPALLALGVGLGMHLESLVELNALQLIIFEPHSDFFYASLFVCDYESVVKKQTKENRKIHFIVDKTPQQLISFFVQIMNSAYYLNLTRIGLFKHYTNQALDDANKLLVQNHPHMMTKGGFIEDTLIGLNHMMIKADRGMQFISKKGMLTEIPVIIIASGPSIDQYIDIIKNYQDKFIIISCSSSIKICHKKGIIPDFHVEVERVKDTIQSLSTLENISLLKQTTLLTLSTVHPDLEAMFKEAYYMFKPNELATDIYMQNLGSVYKNTAPLAYANPTSGNGAVAYAIALGFKNIFLAGMDCANINDQHHSKDTLYYTHNVKVADTDAGLTVMSVKNEILTTNLILDMSRQNIEAILGKNTHINCFNLSLGAHIKNTHFIETSFIKKHFDSIPNALDSKNGFTAEILKKRSIAIHLNQHQKETIKSNLNKIIDACKKEKDSIFKNLKNHQDSWESVYAGLSESQNIMKHFHNSSPLTKHIIDGSFHNIGLCIAAASLSAEKLSEYTIKALDISEEFLTVGIDMLKSDLARKQEDLDFETAIRKAQSL